MKSPKTKQNKGSPEFPFLSDRISFLVLALDYEAVYLVANVLAL